jgi:hypothetical protein
LACRATSLGDPAEMGKGFELASQKQLRRRGCGWVRQQRKGYPSLEPGPPGQMLRCYRDEVIPGDL